MTSVSNNTDPIVEPRVMQKNRELCWKMRDLYHKCLDLNHEQKDKCTNEWENYNKNCLPSWVKHFEQKRQLVKMTPMDIATLRRSAWDEILKNKAQQEQEQPQQQNYSSKIFTEESKEIPKTDSKTK